MRMRRPLISLVALAFWATTASALGAAGQTRLELVGGGPGSALVFHEWGQVLDKAGIKDVRFRPGSGGEKVGIAVQGTEKSPLYIVTGIVISRDELLLPGGKVKRSEAAQLARWLDDLAANGPPDRRPKKTVFGLTKEQFDEVQKDCARPVGFSTQGMSRAEAVEKIGRQMRLPLKVDPQWAQAAGDDKIEEELSTLSCGTVLACVLRPAGFCLVPRDAAGKAIYTVVKARPEMEVWPIGWEPKETPARKLLPDLYEFRNVNVQNVSAAQVLEVVGQRVKVPILMDHNALARHGVDPSKAIVSTPAKRTTYSEALKRLLFPAGLKFEVRVDEAGKPFLWVSTLKPV